MKDILKGIFQRHIRIGQRHRQAKINKTGHPMFPHPAGNDAVEMAEIGIHIQADAVIAHPAPHPNADGRDLVFAPLAPHPNPNPVLAPLAFHIERSKRCNQPFLKPRHKGPHILSPFFQIKHDIGHPLPGPVIGILPAAPRMMNRKAARAE